MKRLLISLGIILYALSVFAYPVHIQSWNMEQDVQTLNSMNVSVDSVNRNTGAIVAYVRNEAEHNRLCAAGFNAVIIPQPEYELCDPKDPTRAYYTITQYHTFMQDTAAQYPDICQLVQFGTSVQNRPLYMLKISDNVNVEENEPELKYVSSIHGDEVVGFDMLIRLIQLLTSEYATNTRVMNIVDNTELWICPMFNPDGYVAQERYNANGIDLNRNFPMPSGSQHPDGNAWGVENVAMMSFSQAHSFNLSMNFHGGYLVINYPWDYTYTLPPDNALLQEISLTYSRENSSLYNDSDYQYGIVNGATWYVITGSMQDWLYGYTDCIDVTAEISMNKWPPSSQLNNFWNLNKESMLKYIEFTQNGLKGLVTTTTGAPLSATITIAGNSKVMHTDPDVGDYHRLLLPGTYQVTASVAGYASQSVSVTVPSTGHAVQNFVFGTVSMEEESIVPKPDVTLHHNYPNPFTSDTILRYSVAKDNTPLNISIYNLKGQLLQTVVNKSMQAGDHNVVFSGEGLASGIYLCRLQSPAGTQTMKILHNK